MSSYSKVRAVDGTMLRAWTNDGTGIPVVISNGLGASPTAWPAIAAPDSGFRVVTWHHRGLGGSERPARAGAIRVEDFASDLGAVMASAGMEHALVVGWSFGVNAAFEFARRQPGRTAGLLAVAGVPGGSLGAMYGPDERSPRPLREPAGQISAQLLPVTGPWLTVSPQPCRVGIRPSRQTRTRSFRRPRTFPLSARCCASSLRMTGNGIPG